MQTIWLSALSDLLINLSAGWFGAAIILPLATKEVKIKRLTLILNIIFGIVALLAAVGLRSLL